MQIKYKKKFIKMYAQSSIKAQRTFDRRLRLFKKDPYAPMLKNHNLKGQYKGLKSINITGDFRAIFEELDHLIIFLLLDSHSNLYK